MAVYDLGGGTFDAAILRNTGQGFELLGDPRGIEQLGGVYFDEAVFAWVVDHMAEAFAQLDPDDPGAMAAVARLRRDCVEAKESLSWDTDTAVPVALPNQRTEVRLTRREFEDMIRPTLVDTLDAVHRSLELGRGAARAAVLGAAGGRLVPHPAGRADARGRPAAPRGHRRPPQARGGARRRPPGRGRRRHHRGRRRRRHHDPRAARGHPRRAHDGHGAGRGRAEMATAAASPSATEAPAAVPAPAGWQTGAPGPGEAPPWGPDSGGRLPRAGENGDARPAAHGPSGRDGEDGRPGRRRNPLVLAGAAVAAVAAAGAVAVFALGGGGDDDPDGGRHRIRGARRGAVRHRAEAPVVELPPDIPRGAPLAA